MAKTPGAPRNSKRQAPVVQMSPAELTAAIAEWDAARDTLDKAGTAAAAAQAALEALPADATAELRQAAQDALNDAHQAVLDAHTAIEGLKPLPEEGAAALIKARGTKTKPEIPAGSQSSGGGKSGAAAPARHPPVQGPGGGATAETTETAPKPDAVASVSGTNAFPDIDALFLEAVDQIVAAQGISRDEFVAFARRFLAAVETAKATSDPIASAAPRQVLVVKARQPSRWRAGRQFTAEETTIPLDELTEDDIAAIEGDPQLASKREERS